MVVIEGVKFRNPIVISSCPLTESALNIEKCIAWQRWLLGAINI